MIESSGQLEWDSNFFGFGVGSINAGNASDDEIDKEIACMQRQGCRLIYVVSHRALTLSKYKAVLTDNKRSYILLNPRHKSTANIIEEISENIPGLYDLAYQAGEHSRFKVDPQVGEESFRRLYRTWIDNSINKGFADYVAAVKEGDKPVGLITARKRATDISIGLFATDNKFRGRGIGSDLIQKIVNLAADEKLNVEVTTQANNVNACKFYENRGFIKNSEEFVYHVWRDDGA